MEGLIYISLITAMVQLSGFWDNLDEWVSKRWKFHHLPYIFTCTYCQTFWLSIIYGFFITKGILYAPLFWVMLSLVNANLAELFIPTISAVKSFILSVINAVIDYLHL